MSSPASGILSSPTIFGDVDFGPTFGRVNRPLNPKRIVTVASTDVILPYDVFVFYNKTVPAAFNVQLPDCALWMRYPYGSFDLTCKDLAGNSNTFPITFLPFGAVQTINGQNAAALGGGWQLASDFGVLIFSPLMDGSGWVTL